MSTTSTQPDLGSNLIRIHRVITRAIEVSTNACKSYLEHGFPDAATREGFIVYVRSLSLTLHGHHQGEDDLAFPCFKLRIPGAPYEQLAAEHRRMIPMLERIDAALDKMNDATAEALFELDGALADLNALWGTHIACEEDHFSCQALAAALRPEDNMSLAQQMAEHAEKHSAHSHLTVPFVLFNLPPDERAEISKLVPPEVINHLIPVVWKEHWSPMKPFLLD